MQLPCITQDHSSLIMYVRQFWRSRCLMSHIYGMELMNLSINMYDEDDDACGETREDTKGAK